MSLRSLALLSSALALALLPIPPLASATIHVAPQGNDANAGTADRPLATPQAARDQARRLIKPLPDPVPLKIQFPIGYRVQAHEGERT